MPFRQSNSGFYVRFYFHQQFFKRWYIGEDVKSLKRPKEFLKMLENGFFYPPRICFFSFPSPFSDSSSSFRSKSHPSSFLNKTFSFIFAFESNGNPLHQRQRLHLHFRGKLIQERFGTFINITFATPGCVEEWAYFFARSWVQSSSKICFFSCFQTLPTLNQYLEVNMFFRLDEFFFK